MKTRLPLTLSGLTLVCAGMLSAADLPTFRAVTVDDGIRIGYGLAIGDVNGDRKPDIVLADADQFVWYENPSWKKHVITEKLTERDHVCLAVRDIDGDGRAEIAVGAQWNPGETSDAEKSGAVFYLIPPGDRTKKWTPVRLHNEPVVHRMRWVRGVEGRHDLVVLPLHGRGNKGGEGDGVRVLAYEKPDNPRDEWKTAVVDDQMHLTHNFDTVARREGAPEAILLAGREGVFVIRRRENEWQRRRIIGNAGGESDFIGAGEVRGGRLGEDSGFLTTVEPMHGNQLVVYTRPPSDNGRNPGVRHVLFDEMADGHALATGDLTGNGLDDIVVGWRGNRRHPANIGVRLYSATDSSAATWTHSAIDSDGMACEDLRLGDLDGDGKLDIVACGRSTRNVKIYFNEGD